MTTKSGSFTALTVTALWFIGFTAAHAQVGVETWVRRYGNSVADRDDRATAVAVDSNSNVFVTGFSFGGTSGRDYLTIKYSSSGVPLWTNRYNGPENSHDQPAAVAVDPSGDIIVTGISFGPYNGCTVIKYSNAGLSLWTNYYDAAPLNTALAVDGSGNVIVTATANDVNSENFLTIKYSSEGVALWTNRYDGEGNSPGYPAADEPYSLAVDRNGNVFVTGYSMGSGGNPDYATVAYSSAGIPLWTNRYNGLDNNYDEPAAITVDTNGDVLVTGYSSDGTGGSAYATIRYSSAGVPLWTNSYKGPWYGNNRATALAGDTSSTVYVTGYSTGGDSGRHYDFATVAYSPEGVALWTNRYDDLGSDDIASAIAVDNNGHVFVSGSSYYGPSDYLTIAYTGAGVPLWTNRYNGPANGDDVVATKSCLAIGPDGSVYVTGSSDGNYTTTTTSDYATVKYSTFHPQLTIVSDCSGGFFVRFQGVPGNSYRLQRAVGLTGPWINSTVQAAQSSGLVEFHDSPSIDRTFYRVQVE